MAMDWRTYTAAARAGSLLRAWVLAPAGVTAMLLACFGVDALFGRLAVAFPASVACLVLLFGALLGCEAVVGARATRRLVGAVDVPAGWALRWINVFFTPAFVMLPLSPPIGVVEVFTVMAVFVVGFLVMMALAAYLTRGLQLVLGLPKRADAQRAEELRDDGGGGDGGGGRDVVLGHVSAGPSRAPSISPAALSTTPLSTTPLSTTPLSTTPLATTPLAPTPLAPGAPQSPPPLRLQQHRDAADDTGPGGATPPPPPARARRWAARLTRHLDAAIFAAVLLAAGLPVYFATGYAMPMQLSASVLCYFAAMGVPAAWRQYLHPVLVCSLLTVLVIWPLAEIRGDGLAAALRAIVSLALPMFQHRRELRAHFVAIAAPSVLIAVGSLLAYPPLCSAVAIAPERSLAFASRSLTLALATPATRNLGGDVNTVAALAIVSGILGVLVGQRLMTWMRIPEDDYVTRGVTLGVNSSAIATALLLRTDPRAAALSSLSMGLFGTVTVLFTSIPPIAAFIRSLVGL
ncbi:Plastidal glycolate/glycerate translocator 1, chloroplastic [Tolypocladium ophioglossoides CBS 100239]|uniref:Plastidal glycolate/glycerate translocator 1, chloroplastic n=1 Tax=Tolypocladium ophioglossoides (strain CBS 100239) TaxID=1163406 RepID=A0A0L0N593_TOLOC|nr:Plastidal glycolate/glycerate translocator 1, chloroplastic [Tolypocladium ophioglossoides CBS 100239]